MRNIVPLFLTATAPLKQVELYSGTIPLFPSLDTYYGEGYGLDVNCNTGETTQKIQSCFPNLRFYGMDRNQAALEIAKRSYQNTHFIRGDLEENPFPPLDPFQVIQISNYTDCWRILRNSYHFLEDDGILILHYKEEDTGLMYNLMEKNRKYPTRQIDNQHFENMYLFPKDKTAVLFK